MPSRIIGTCSLTRTVGPLAKSHIIPRSFLRRASDGPFVEWGGDGFPRKMQDGWYDTGLLTDAGERHFNAVDDAAAKCFVDGGFTYRKRRDPADVRRLTKRFEPHAFYRAECADSRLIRLFALSLLWRAAVSSVPAFDLVRLSPAHAENLRQRILAGDPGPPTEFAAFFGLFCDAVELCKIAPHTPRGLPFVRFFLDGVVCYVSPIRRTRGAERYGKLLAGSDVSGINLLCMPSLGSAQEAMTNIMMDEMLQKHGKPFKAYDEHGRRVRLPGKTR